MLPEEFSSVGDAEMIRRDAGVRREGRPRSLATLGAVAVDRRAEWSAHLVSNVPAKTASFQHIESSLTVRRWLHSLGLLQHPECILTKYLPDLGLGVPALEKAGGHIGESRDVARPFGKE